MSPQINDNTDRSFYQKIGELINSVNFLSKSYDEHKKETSEIKDILTDMQFNMKEIQGRTEEIKKNLEALDKRMIDVEKKTIFLTPQNIMIGFAILAVFLNMADKIPPIFWEKLPLLLPVS